MSIFKKIAVRIIPVAFLAFVVTVAIAYQRGALDLSFTDNTTDTSDTAVTDTHKPDTMDTAAPDTSDTAKPDTSADTEPVPDNTVDVADFLSGIKQTSNAIGEGYNITDTVWGDSYLLTRLIPEHTLPTAYSLRTRIEKVPERVTNTEDSGYTTVINDVTVNRPALEVYMDYILVDNGTSVDILSRDGKLIMSGVDTEMYVPAYTRDKNDRPLFIFTRPSQYYPSQMLTSYCYIDEGGNFVDSDYNDATDSRGLYMNYPSYFGKSDHTNAFVTYDEESGLFGYANANGAVHNAGYKYQRAYSFNNGFGCIVDENGFMHWLDENLITKISELPQYRYNGYHIWSSSNRRLYHVYLRPDTFGEESRGMFYFDNGLILVRRQTIDAGHHDLGANSSWDVVTDTEVLIRRDDTEFPLPPDYKLVSYSNGMILLEKNGKRGFMDNLGKWIVQPVYDYAEPFCEGLAVIGNGEKMGVVDTSGNFVIPMIFDSIENVSGGIIAAYSDADGWALFNKMTAVAAQ